MKAGPGGDVVLPRRVQLFYLAVAEAPWTNLKQLNALVMDWATAFFLAIAAVLGYEVKEPILYAWLLFLSGMNGFAMASAGWKRSTYRPSPPYGPDIEDAQAGATSEQQVPDPPRGGQRPRNRDVREPIEQYAERQRATTMPAAPAEPLD